MDITVGDLFRIIGQKEAEIITLRQEIEELQKPGTNPDGSPVGEVVEPNKTDSTTE